MVYLPTFTNQIQSNVVKYTIRILWVTNRAPSVTNPENIPIPIVTHLGFCFGRRQLSELGVLLS